jgi:hypothetical protein
MKHIDGERTAIAAREQDAERMELKTKIEIEKLILGTLSVEEI